MRESSWFECLENNTTTKITPNPAKIKSLLETSLGRISFLKNNTITEENARYIFEGYYSSVLETLHALAISKGFNVLNHLCLGYFLKNVIQRDDLYRLFDDCRIKRNLIVYYGRKLDKETATKSIENSLNLIKELNALIKI